MSAGHLASMEYRELLQMVLHNVGKPTAESRQAFTMISRKIAQAVTDLVATAESLKGKLL